MNEGIKCSDENPHEHSHLEKMLGKVAIITGSSAGIGAGIAYEFARRGALLTLSGRNEMFLNEVAQKCHELSPECNKTKPPITVTGDITRRIIREKLINDTLKYYNHLDILVNNAGHFKSNTLESEADLTDLDEMLDIHVRVPFHLTKLAIPHLIKSKGNIVNISSRSSFKPAYSRGAEYSIAKAGMDQLTKWLAFELGPKGVRSNSVNPANIITNIVRNVESLDEMKEVYDRLARTHALHRCGRIEECANTAAFLASEEASFVSGVTLLVDGGNSVVPVDAFKD